MPPEPPTAAGSQPGAGATILCRGGELGVVIAMEEEARDLHHRLAPGTPLQTPTVVSGVLGGVAVSLAVSGVGKVAAAAATQRLCQPPRGRMVPAAVVVLGLAGGLDPRLDPRLGLPHRRPPAVIATVTRQHDYDARPLVAAAGIVPHLQRAELASPGELVEALQRACDQVLPETALRGLVISGDCVVTSTRARQALLEDHPGVLAVDMETAAVAQVALQNGVQWGALRLISDAADEAFAVADLLGAAQWASRTIAAVVTELAGMLRAR